MRQLSTFLTGALAGAALLYLAMTHHLLRTHDGLHLVRKVETQLPDAYVDVRHFSADEWTRRPQLSAAVGQSDKRYLLRRSASEPVSGNLYNSLDQYRRP